MSILAILALVLVALPFVVAAVLVWIEPSEGSDWFGT